MKTLILILSLGFLVPNSPVIKEIESTDGYKLRISDNYSHRNISRPYRASTKYIVLHTTESNDRSALNAVKAKGLCNYLVMTNGQVYRIIDKNKVAMHAGRSVWDGTYSLSNHAVGIEIVGYHNRKPTYKQKLAIKELLRQLQGYYHLSDDKVVTHSMVAYSRPNKFHKHSHRGRKRCAMLYATKDLRKELGLTNTFKYDPEIQKGRLIQADKVLGEVLYGKGGFVKKGYSHQENPVSVRSFEGFRTVPKDGKTAWAIARNDYNASTTIYFLPDGKVRTGKELSKKTLNALPSGTKILVGYVYGGHVTKQRSAFSIAKKEWNYPSTFYRLPDGSVKSGDEVSDSGIPPKTLVLFMK
jgi:N-acetylmuramoyl-L-alanine amidase